MSTKQSSLKKGNQKAGAEDQRHSDNERRDVKNQEQSRNDKKHLQQEQASTELGTSKLPASDQARK